MEAAANSIAELYDKHVHMVYRLCCSYLGPSEAEDATQAVFTKLVEHPRAFESTEHERAWLVRVAANWCKDVLKSARVSKAGAMPADVEDASSETASDTADAIMRLPALYKDCVYLHYYEGYTSAEIAQIIDVSASTVRTRLAEARKLLKEMLEA